MRGKILKHVTASIHTHPFHAYEYKALIPISCLSPFTKKLGELNPPLINTKFKQNIYKDITEPYLKLTVVIAIWKQILNLKDSKLYCMKNYYEKSIKGNECLESRLCKRKKFSKLSIVVTLIYKCTGHGV